MIKSVAKKQRGPVAAGEFDKKAFVAQHAGAGMTVGQIAKAASAASGGRLSLANARYLAQKHVVG